MRSFKIALVAIAVLAVVGLGRLAFHSIYNSGYQRGADSVATTADSQKVAAVTHVKDSLLAQLVASKPVVRDSDAAVRRDVSALNDRVAKLRQAPIPAVAVTGRIDSVAQGFIVGVHIAGDTAIYHVPMAVGLWVVAADTGIAQRDSVIRSDSVLINVRFPALLKLRDDQLRIAEASLAASDSLDSVRRHENDALRRRIADLTPSAVQKTGKLVLYALATYGAVEVAHRVLH